MNNTETIIPESYRSKKNVTKEKKIDIHCAEKKVLKTGNQLLNCATFIGAQSEKNNNN